MTRLLQKPLSYYENLPETYVPSERDQAAGKWVVIPEFLEEDGNPDLTTTLHILPTFGRHHQIHASCWCCPEVKQPDDGPTYLCHHVPH